MTREEIQKHIFTWLTKNSKTNDDKYFFASQRLADILTDFNKRERHALYMALKGIKK